VLLIVLTFAGVALASGLARHDAYGAAPVAGAVLAVIGGAAYAAFLLLFRGSQRRLGPPAGPLLDSTIGTAIGALGCAIFDPRFSLAPTWPAHGWLIALALLSQVIGWLCIGAVLPRLPAVETSIMLLAQPVLTVVWGVMLFAEHLSAVQTIGAAMVLGGVAFVSRQGSVAATEAGRDGDPPPVPAGASIYN
jgi:drug/metabolite transporter (DMT)-like permease